MTTITLSSAAIKNMFEQLHHNFGGSLSVNVKEHILTLDNELGRGHIRGITFKGGISYLEFDMEFSEDVTLRTGTDKNAPICFAYCSEGRIEHSFNNESERHTLENFQTGILTNESNAVNTLYFRKDVRVNTSLIVVKTVGAEQTEKRNGLNYRLQERILKGKTAENTIYIGSYNLKIADQIKQLKAIKQQGIVRSLLIEGLVHMILALEVQQHTDDLKNQKNQTGSLNTREMESVRDISSFVHNYPERQLSIAELCRKSGLSPCKLQEGFKLMHGTTVTDYIREVRIKKAEELIKNTDLNISEVVYSIGFTSRSYFSKIFRNKYNCSPKQYKDKQNMMAVSA
ncbi:helix-turn-helix domain-containing protein [Zobellia galactanivorans]|uniref:helix-turn-helix domain-containing protein n=1 Tax=Zobellia galactanivorans (strain DSM 12802 / CCUG 47099 / CIP 106680 / NCIMB 13871 / Dsij) TaxID=63186 RepID=UPI001C072B4B|nr:AraC family transcriptional regulator [Zobellia galactanivorans]MBU3028364.1 AraC family transcriptional regulator [Zobellia galactanivorans]